MKSDLEFVSFWEPGYVFEALESITVNRVRNFRDMIHTSLFSLITVAGIAKVRVKRLKSKKLPT